MTPKEIDQIAKATADHLRDPKLLRIAKMIPIIAGIIVILLLLIYLAAHTLTNSTVRLVGISTPEDYHTAGYTPYMVTREIENYLDSIHRMDLQRDEPPRAVGSDDRRAKEGPVVGLDNRQAHIDENRTTRIPSVNANVVGTGITLEGLIDLIRWVTPGIENNKIEVSVVQHGKQISVRLAGLRSVDTLPHTWPDEGISLDQHLRLAACRLWLDRISSSAQPVKREMMHLTAAQYLLDEDPLAFHVFAEWLVTKGGYAGADWLNEMIAELAESYEKPEDGRQAIDFVTSEAAKSALAYYEQQHDADNQNENVANTLVVLKNAMKQKDGAAQALVTALSIRETAAEGLDPGVQSPLSNYVGGDLGLAAAAVNASKDSDPTSKVKITIDEAALQAVARASRKPGGITATEQNREEFQTLVQYLKTSKTIDAKDKAALKQIEARAASH